MERFLTLLVRGEATPFHFSSAALLICKTKLSHNSLFVDLVSHLCIAEWILDNSFWFSWCFLVCFVCFFFSLWLVGFQFFVLGDLGEVVGSFWFLFCFNLEFWGFFCCFCFHLVLFCFCLVWFFGWGFFKNTCSSLHGSVL